MARTKSNIATVPQDELLEGTVVALNQQQNEAGQRLEKIVAQFGDGLPFDPLRYEDKIRGHLSRSAEEMLAAGRALVVAREHLPHGEWGNFLTRIGLEESVARRMSQAAIKFSNRATSHALLKAAGTKSKLFELMVLDDEDITELNDGGTVAGLELDDIARMPVSELRKALRDAREEKKAIDQLLAEKNTAMDELKAELKKTTTRIQAAPPDEVAEQLRSELLAQATGAESAISSGLRAAINLLTQHDQEHGTDHRAIIAGHFTRIQQVMDDLRNEFAIGAFTTATPEWATEE